MSVPSSVGSRMSPAGHPEVISAVNGILMICLIAYHLYSEQFFQFFQAENISPCTSRRFKVIMFVRREDPLLQSGRNKDQAMTLLNLVIRRAPSHEGCERKEREDGMVCLRHKVFNSWSFERAIISYFNTTLELNMSRPAGLTHRRP